MIEGQHWYAVKDGDARGLALYRRHYSARRYRDGREATRRLFVGPGEKLVLLTVAADALFVWRNFISDDGQTGINCAIFRNEGPVRASELIREAVALAWTRWPGQRLYTYVNPRKVAGTCPGYCFIRAGWRRVGESKRQLLIFAIA